MQEGHLLGTADGALRDIGRPSAAGSARRGGSRRSPARVRRASTALGRWRERSRPGSARWRRCRCRPARSSVAAWARGRLCSRWSQGPAFLRSPCRSASPRSSVIPAVTAWQAGEDPCTSRPPGRRLRQAARIPQRIEVTAAPVEERADIRGWCRSPCASLAARAAPPACHAWRLDRDCGAIATAVLGGRRTQRAGLPRFADWI